MIRVDKIESIHGTIRVNSNSAVCPICGVISNLWPDYLNSKGTAVLQRLIYCGHQAEGYHNYGKTIASERISSPD